MPFFCHAMHAVCKSKIHIMLSCHIHATVSTICCAKGVLLTLYRMPRERHRNVEPSGKNGATCAEKSKRVAVVECGARILPTTPLRQKNNKPNL